MRGVVSGGMVSALEFLGLRDVFDVVYGSSSGAMAGAYFVARQARFGTTIYYQCINNRNFIRKSNVLLSRPIMNTAFLLDEVCRNMRPLRASEIVHGELPLRVVASSVTKRSPVVISDFLDEREVFEALRCSINVPGIAGPPISFRGDRLFDAALYESIPLRSARNGGATHALVLQTRAAGAARTAPTTIQSMWLRHLLRDQPGEIVSDWLQSHRAYASELVEIREAENGRLPDIDAHRVQITGACRNITPLETRGSVLVAAALAGFEAVIKAFGLSEFIATQVPGGAFQTGPFKGLVPPGKARKETKR